MLKYSFLFSKSFSKDKSSCAKSSRCWAKDIPHLMVVYIIIQVAFVNQGKFVEAPSDMLFQTISLVGSGMAV